MEIEILLEELSLLSTKYIKLINKKDIDKIVVKRNDIKFINLKFSEISNKDIIMNVCFKHFKREYIFNISDVLLKTNEIILTGVLNDQFSTFHQGYIDNFKLLTDTKGKIKWYELNNKQKYYYLRCCALLNGVRESIDNMNSMIIVDFSKAKTDLDIYYEIGKAFFNSYGYFGTEFHSFRDCLINIENSLKGKEEIPILKVKGYRNFEKYFLTNILFNDFYEEFTKVGFKIQNS